MILEQLHSLEVTGRDLVVQDVIVEYVIKHLTGIGNFLKHPDMTGLRFWDWKRNSFMT